jgi:hypothetical protein
MREASALTSVPLAESLVQDVLSPYKPHCRYLKRAFFEPRDAESPWWTEARGPCALPPLAHYRGEFAIAESCYIDETGHFNAVEFNICFNQFYYVTLAHGVVNRLFPALGVMTYEEYRRRQLPDVLIHEFRSVFKKPLDRSRFTGRFAFTEVTDHHRFILFKTRCRFQDARGASAHGEVTLVLMNRESEAGTDFGSG